MDFGALLSAAQKNETSHKQQPIACYQTKFAPPKKLAKQTKTLSVNIKKFLARKEEEERQKALEEQKKKENLLSLRDHKAQSRINKHLKVCKSANKAAIADAVDADNTAVTMAGPSQPDEDDYGYVSQEASAFYNQLMNKYNSAPAQKPLFSSSGKKTVKDIASTKDRVKQALKQQEEEEALGHRRKRKSTGLSKGEESEEKCEENSTEFEKEKDKNEQPKVKRKLAPPPMDFGELLKIAEKKQHEPIMIEVKPKSEEPERLMTKKQMKEYAKEREAKERREQREKADLLPKNSSSKLAKALLGKIPKTTSSTPSVISSSAATDKDKAEKTEKSPPSHTSSSALSKPVTKPVTTPSKKPRIPDKPSEKSTPTKSSVIKNSEKDLLLEERKKLEAERRKLEEMRQAIEEEKRKLAKTKTKQEKPMVKSKPLEKPSPKELKTKSPTISSATPSPGGPSQKPRVPPILNGKPKQFPPADLKPFKTKQNMSKESRKPPMGHKRRIYDDDDEYDSELDDFIDDGPEEETEDYSKYISEIFGYDKSRYRHGEDYDDTAMESSFAQQLKEEYVSTKIGIMEDLEDMRMEAMEKKRKAQMRKKLKK